MTAPFYLSGTEPQKKVAADALAVCDFPFERLLPSLQREGRQTIRVEWADLSRYTASTEKAGHDHVHDGDAVAHPVERVVDGRARVLGLFYLPPHTRIVLDLSLERSPRLGMEVLLAEAAHAVDYHYMTPDMRRAFVNSVHRDQLNPSYLTDDGVAFHLDGHECSWFDVGPYDMWVGEAFMEGFVEAFAPSVPVTIQLSHPVGWEDVAVIRYALGMPNQQPEQPQESVPPGPVDAPAPVVPEPASVAPRDDEHDVFVGPSGEIYHDSHKGVKRGDSYANAAAALAAGFRPCGVCKPGR